jgi:3-methyl-2-oxobutanoate hydroxymethyltransferase
MGDEEIIMSHNSSKIQAITTTSIMSKKGAGDKISMVTCYDSSFGKIVEDSKIDMVLVGDSVGNVMLGYSSTIPVSIDDMIHHAAAVTRVVKRPFVAADLPFLTYSSVEVALLNAGKLMQRGGVQGVKLEGGTSFCPQVSALVEAGIPVIGHLGLTPQSVHSLGGYKVQARQKDAQEQLMKDAKALESAGVFCLVLEMIPSDLAQEVSKALKVPVIGIGAGSGCDGQVLVLQDLLGFDRHFNPKFLKKYANLDEVIGNALEAYDKDVKSGIFPAAEHSFSS